MTKDTVSETAVLSQSFMGGFYSGPVVEYIFAKSSRRGTLHDH
jgi:hypothetical protein